MCVLVVGDDIGGGIVVSGVVDGEWDVVGFDGGC